MVPPPSYQTIDPLKKFRYALGVRSLFLVLLLVGPASARKPNTKSLADSFGSAKAEDKIRMAPSLGRLKDKKTTDALILAFDIKRGNPRESAAYIEAFGYTGDPRVIEPLSGAWDYLHTMILQMGELPGNLQVLRWKILDSLSRVGGEQAERILTLALNDADPRVVEEAVRGLGRLQIRDAVPALQQLAGSATGNLLQAIFEALGDIGDKRALSTLDQAWNNPDKFIEVEVSYASAKLGKKEALPRLIAFLDGDPGESKVGLLAAYYLVKLDKDAGLKRLEDLMKKPDSPLAPLAAETLGKTENPRAVLVLVEAFKAPDPGVRLAVARSLTRLGGSRAAQALKKLRTDTNPGVRSAAINGLADLGETD